MRNSAQTHSHHKYKLRGSRIKLFYPILSLSLSLCLSCSISLNFMLFHRNAQMTERCTMTDQCDSINSPISILEPHIAESRRGLFPFREIFFDVLLLHFLSLLFPLYHFDATVTVVVVGATVIVVVVKKVYRKS